MGSRKLQAVADVREQFNVLPESAGTVLYVQGLLVGLVMWAMIIPWACFAVGSISQSKFPFNMGWWGFTFPIGMLLSPLPSKHLGLEKIRVCGY